ncbi:MAG: hypothetical protein WD509_01090 [Candidatus Paceibacterota bacterium]
MWQFLVATDFLESPSGLPVSTVVPGPLDQAELWVHVVNPVGMASAVRLFAALDLEGVDIPELD